MSSSSSNNDPPPTNPILDCYEKFSHETPYVTRTILSVLVVSYLVSWFIDAQYALGNIPQFTIFEFEVYRIMLSPLVNDSLFSLIFAFWSFKDVARRLEYSSGSTAFGWVCIITGLLSNIAFLVLSFLLYVIIGETYFLIQSSSGVWIILFGMIALECVRAPRGTKRRLFVTEVPVRYYPLFLYVLFAFLSHSLLLGQLISMGLGYLLGFISGGDLAFPGSQAFEQSVLINSAKAKDLEDRYLGNLTNKQGWVVSHAATGSGAWSEGEEGGLSLPLFQSSTMRRDPNENAAGADTGASFGSVFREGRNNEAASTATSNTNSLPETGGQALGGPSRRAVSASEARQARLNALEKKQQEK